MTIAEIREKSNGFLSRAPRDALIVGILLAASFASFGLGFLAGQEGLQGSGITISTSPFATTSTAGKFVASRSGTKYYLPSCGGADRISESNRIWFATQSDAIAAGYAPAANCGGR